MINFLKHHWSKREKFMARWSLRHLAYALAVGALVTIAIVLHQAGQDKVRINDLQGMAKQVEGDTQMPPGTKHIGGPFELIDQDKKTVTDATFHGKYMLIYFGYTYCPDMCPTGLQSMAHAMDLLGKDAERVAPIFITIDPARDKPEKLKSYVASFHPQVVGLSGSAQQIAAAAAAYQVYYARGEQVDDHDYVMDHSSLIYLMNTDGTFLKTFPEEVDPEALAKAIRDQKS